MNTFTHQLISKTALVFATLFGAVSLQAEPIADFLFVGSFHMNNPGLDLVNVKADDVLSDKRQAEIRDISRALEKFHPTKIMVEIDVTKQSEVDKNYQQTCLENTISRRSESYQLGARTACALSLKNLYAVDTDDSTPVKDIDYQSAVKRYHQEDRFKKHIEFIESYAFKSDLLLKQGTVLDAIRHLNSEEYLSQDAIAYFHLTQLGTLEDPVGTNWVQYWFGRNLRIFNNIVSHTEKGDRVLVVYGAGHGNYLRQLAKESGLYRVQNTNDWLITE
ncbi:hypothetical protein MAH1_17200 [Sessilibacter sp. MAH1]